MRVKLLLSGRGLPSAALGFLHLKESLDRQPLLARAGELSPGLMQRGLAALQVSLGTGNLPAEALQVVLDIGQPTGRRPRRRCLLGKAGKLPASSQ